jgi:uncharacterized membrane protein YhaH (DUF805 family)
MLQSIRHNFANLLRFSGRDSRATFWPWAIGVYLLSMLLGFLIVLPLIGEMMQRMAAYAQAHPGGFPPPQPGKPPFPAELMPDFSSLAVPMGLVQLLTTFLWAAAAVRRLHDRDWSGWWAAIFLPFQVAGIALGGVAMRGMLGGAVEPTPLMRVASLNTACYWIAFIGLLVVLAGSGTPGPNRYGDPPPA